MHTSTCMHMCACYGSHLAQTHTHTHTHTCTHTHTHTHTHSPMQYTLAFLFHLPLISAHTANTTSGGLWTGQRVSSVTCKQSRYTQILCTSHGVKNTLCSNSKRTHNCVKTCTLGMLKSAICIYSMRVQRASNCKYMCCSYMYIHVHTMYCTNT